MTDKFEQRLAAVVRQHDDDIPAIQGSDLLNPAASSGASASRRRTRWAPVLAAVGLAAAVVGIAVGVLQVGSTATSPAGSAASGTAIRMTASSKAAGPTSAPPSWTGQDTPCGDPLPAATVLKSTVAFKPAAPSGLEMTFRNDSTEAIDSFPSISEIVFADESTGAVVGFSGVAAIPVQYVTLLPGQSANVELA